MNDEKTNKNQLGTDNNKKHIMTQTEIF